MKKWLTLFIVLITTSLLNGCSLDNGSPADPPTNMATTAGDGRVKVTWTGNSGVDYWLFTAADAALTAFNWVGLTNSHVYINVQTPFYMCGLLNGTTYYFAANGRVNGGPGGASSLTVNDIPRIAGSTWNAVTATPLGDLLGVGYMGLSACTNNSTSAAGSFAAVGVNGTIFTSDKIDGIAPTMSWTSHSVSAAFPHNFYAVAGYAANQNNTATPTLRWVAVGDGGASFISTDAGAATWSPGTIYDSVKPALRSVMQTAGTFWAVGDTGTIQSSTDGITWTIRTSNTTNNLRNITYGNGLFLAVGDAGTIITSTDGVTWIVRTSNTSENLRQVSSMLATFVAVGDNGAIVTSTDQGATWTKQSTSLGTPNFVGIASNLQQATIDSNGTVYTSSTTGIAANMRFVVIDSSGNSYTSPDGIDWTTAGISTGVSSLNTLVSSGFGYVAVGNAGATVSAF